MIALYVLSNGYVGITKDLELRLAEHRVNKNRDATLIHYWFVRSRTTALILEYFIQSFSKSELWGLILDCPNSIKFLYKEADKYVRADRGSKRHRQFERELNRVYL